MKKLILIGLMTITMITTASFENLERVKDNYHTAEEMSNIGRNDYAIEQAIVRGRDEIIRANQKATMDIYQIDLRLNEVKDGNGKLKVSYVYELVQLGEYKVIGFYTELTVENYALTGLNILEQKRFK